MEIVELLHPELDFMKPNRPRKCHLHIVLVEVPDELAAEFANPALNHTTDHPASSVLSSYLRVMPSLHFSTSPRFKNSRLIVLTPSLSDCRDFFSSINEFEGLQLPLLTLARRDESATSRNLQADRHFLRAGGNLLEGEGSVVGLVGPKTVIAWSGD